MSSIAGGLRSDVLGAEDRGGDLSDSVRQAKRCYGL